MEINFLLSNEAAGILIEHYFACPDGFPVKRFQRYKTMLGPCLFSDPRLTKQGCKNAQLVMTDGEQGQHGGIRLESADRIFLACLHFEASLCTAGPAFSSSFGIPAGSL